MVRGPQPPALVLAGLVPAIHVVGLRHAFQHSGGGGAGMAGTSPAKTRVFGDYALYLALATH